MFNSGDIIVFCGDYFTVLQDCGVFGKVINNKNNVVIDRFYWNFCGEKSKKVS